MDENIELDEQPNSLDENTATDFSFLDEDDSGRDDVIDSVEVPETAPTETVENTDTVETPAVEVESSPYEFLTMSAMENAKSDETEMSPVSNASSVTEMLTNAAMENAAKGNEYAQSAKTDATKETKAEEESKKGTFSDKLQESIDAIKQSIDMIKESGKGSSKEINDKNSFKDLMEHNKEASKTTEAADKVLKGEASYSLPEPKAEEVRDVQIGKDGKIEKIETSEPFTNKEDLRDMALSGYLHDKIELMQENQSRLQEALKNAETDEEKNSIRSAMISNNSAINYYQKAEKEAFEAEFDKDPSKVASKLAELQAELDDVTNRINAGDISAENVNLQTSLYKDIDTYTRAAEYFEKAGYAPKSSKISTDSSKTAAKKAAEEKPAEKTPTAAPPALIEDETKTPITETSAPTPVDDTVAKTPETIPADEPNNENATAGAEMVNELQSLSNPTASAVTNIISKFDPTLANFMTAVTQDWTNSNAASGQAYSQRGQALAQQLSNIWTNKSNVLQAVWDSIKAVVKAAGDFKDITKDTQAYRLIKNAQRLTTRAIITAVAAVTGGPLAAVAIWAGSLAKGQLVNLVKNTTLDPEIAKIYESFSDTQDRNETTDETEGKNYEEGLIKKWDKNDVTIDNKGYNKGLEEKEVSRKELPSDAFVKIIYKNEPWIRKFHV